MRILSPGSLVGLVVSAALLATCTASTWLPAAAHQTPSLAHSMKSSIGRVHVNSRLSHFTVAPGRAGQIAAHVPFGNRVRSWIKPDKKGGCMYLSDNLSGLVNIYSSLSPYNQTGTLSSSSLYGWGVDVSKKEAFIGTYADTIDVYAACNGTTVIRTLTGTGQGYPYGVTASTKGEVYATEWPTNLIDYFDASGTLVSQTAVANMASIYTDKWDKIDNGSRRKSEGLFVGGFAYASSFGIVDTCSPTLSTCEPLNGVTTGFPGGITLDNSPADLIYVNDQYGTLTSYACTDPPSNNCSATGSFTYNNGTNPLDYTAITLATKEVGGTALNLWGANIYYCSSSYGICGDAQQQSLPLSTASLNGNTAQWSNAEPLGIAVWPPAKT